MDPRAALCERLLSKIVMPGPATPCATWVGAYNRPSARSERAGRKPAHRPVISKGARAQGMIYVAPTLLQLAAIVPAREDQVHAAHRCRMGVPVDGVYRCVDLDCLRWASPAENEADKYDA
jgi:hypothetical protein